MYVFLQTAKSPLYQGLRRKIDPRNPEYFFENDAHGLRKVVSDRNYAFLTDETTFDTIHLKNYDFVQDQDCVFVRSQESFFPQAYAFALQKNSPYTDIFSVT